MNCERAKELLPIIEAFVNGELIQVHAPGSDWVDTTVILSASEIRDSMPWNYRIKPKSSKPREYWIPKTGNKLVKIIPASEGGFVSDPSKWIKVREVIE